jgi:hypothetical protein
MIVLKGGSKMRWSSHVRKIVLRILERLAFNVRIRNPWSGSAFHLNTCTHKSYWFYGKRRERAVMLAFERLIRENDVVLEVGGHIGYLSQFFSSIVGSQGVVRVFEPGSNNIPYLVKNTEELTNVGLVFKAVSNFSGQATFYDREYHRTDKFLGQEFFGCRRDL